MSVDCPSLPPVLDRSLDNYRYVKELMVGYTDSKGDKVAGVVDPYYTFAGDKDPSGTTRSNCNSVAQLLEVSQTLN